MPKPVEYEPPMAQLFALQLWHELFYGKHRFDFQVMGALGTALSLAFLDVAPGPLIGTHCLGTSGFASLGGASLRPSLRRAKVWYPPLSWATWVVKPHLPFCNETESCVVLHLTANSTQNCLPWTDSKWCGIFGRSRRITFGVVVLLQVDSMLIDR